MTSSANGNTLTEFTKYRVLIVDDHPIVRHGLAELIAHEPDLEVCGEAGDTPEALRQVDTTQPHVVIVDISLKSGHGIDLIEQIKAKDERIKMLVSSIHDESLFAERALRAGAMGYINKQEATEKVIDAVRQVLRGEIYLSPRMSNRLLHTVVGGDRLNSNPIEGLSNRELEVFEMIGQGLTTKQIAGKLHLSPKTIETHREKIKMKLNLANSTELSHRAVQWVLENR
ncbi:MAG: response regulator transcription factor [Pirellulales bacterium]|nr:response regulator transcription factor [Pirellulales bacterium]